MNNLIKEIEETIKFLKEEEQKCYEDINYPISLADNIAGQIKAYTLILEILNEYNINILKELRNKETPMKVIYENDLVDENVIVNTWAYCPTCKEEIPFELWENLNYCPNCGQRLDWSVEE